MVKDNDVKFVGFRFTDTLGKEQSVTIPADQLTEDQFEVGHVFDGSSIKGWRGIEASDMLLLPDPETARMDPFREQNTLLLTCDVVEPDTGKGYERDPRSLAKRAEAYLKSTGIGDTAYFGPELEFFIFDSVRYRNDSQDCFYKIESEEAPWSTGLKYEGGNLAHRALTKGGYFPVPPVDKLMDIRAEMCTLLAQQGIPVEVHHHEVGAAGQCEIGTRFSSLVQRADWSQIQKYTIWNVAAAYGKTATFTKGDETITVDYSTLSETLTVRKDVHTSSSVTGIIKDDKDLEKAYDELWKQIQEIQSKLQPGEELRIGETKIDSTTQKEDIIKYFTKAISPDDMSKDELIKALQEQERIAKSSTYVANKGSDYEETKKNYYSGEKTDEFKYFSKAPDDSKIEVYWKWTWWGGYYYYTDANGQEVRVHSNTVHSEEQRDDIKHLDLASGSKLDLLPDEDGKVNQTDCVLVSKDLKLEWNYDAGNLVNGKGNQPVGLDSKISWDDEGGEGDGHYEYDRGNPNKNPDKSAYYKLTGTVAYDPIKDKDGSIKLYQGQWGDYWNPGISAEDEAINAYLKATGSSKTYRDLTTKERNAIVGTYVVKIGTTGTNSTGESGYQVYLKSSELTAYGYMSRDANTCINSTYKRQDGTWGYVGGYDLMISKLTQVSEGKVIGQTESTIKTITAPLSIRSSQDFAKRLLELNKQTTTTHKTGEGATAYGENTSGDFDGTYTQKKSETVEASGTGSGHYTTFTEVLKKIFSGSGSKEHDEGSVSYTHRTTDKVNTTPVSKETMTTTDAHVDYNYTSIETRTVTVNGEETVIVPPVTPPETPVEDETPDEVVMTPETPELPPVQDATPDAPVLPSDAVLPAVQDALPQTGVNWMAALGMAFSGMLLTIAGAFASLKYKEKH